MSTETSVLFLWPVVLVQGALLLLLYRQHGLLLLRGSEGIKKDGPPIKSELTKSVVESLGLDDSSSFQAGGVTGTAILFARPNCGACVSLWPEFGDLASVRPRVRFTVVFGGDDDAAKRYREEHAIPCRILADPDELLFSSLRVRVVPFAVVVDQNHRVLAKGLASDQTHLANLTTFLDPPKGSKASEEGVDRREDVHAAELAR